MLYFTEVSTLGFFSIQILQEGFGPLISVLYLYQIFLLWLQPLNIYSIKRISKSSVFLSHTSHCADFNTVGFNFCWLYPPLTFIMNCVEHWGWGLFHSRATGWRGLIPSHGPEQVYGLGLDCVQWRGVGVAGWGGGAVRHELWDQIIWIKLDKLLNLSVFECIKWDKTQSSCED